MKTPEKIKVKFRNKHGNFFIIDKKNFDPKIHTRYITFDELRGRITDDQRWILSRIWNHYLKKDEWILEQVLYHPGKERQNKMNLGWVLESLQGLVIRFDEAGRYRYKLTLPGVLLSDRGKEAEGIISFYLKYLQSMYWQNPHIEQVNSQTLVDENIISRDLSDQLGKLIQLSRFLCRPHFSSRADGWSAGIPSDLLIDVSKIEDLEAYIRDRVMDEYDPDLPIKESERVWYFAEKEEDEKILSKKAQNEIIYVDLGRINELRAITSKRFDLAKLIRLCEELNISYANGCFLAVAMLVRAILDHVPPIFNCPRFGQVANNYSGSTSFKQSMGHLENSSRKIADSHLHVQVRKKETLPNKTQVNFSNDLDMLLAEIVRILK